MINTTPPTPIELQAPLGADHWRKVFNLAELTLLPGSFDRVRQALHHPNSNAERVAQAMSHDPALCLHFCLRANRVMSRTGNEAHSLSHVVSLLGMTSVGQILTSLPVAERPLPFYWQQLQISLLRRNLLRALPLGGLGIDASQLEFAVLFSDCDQWLMWHFAAKQQQHFEGLARNPKIGEAKAKQLAFGAAVDSQLRAKLAQQDLPQELKSSLIQPISELKALMRSLLKAQKAKAFQAPMHKRQALIFLLDRLVACFCKSPYDKTTLRYQGLLAQLLQTGDASVGRALHQAAAQLLPAHPSLIDIHPARRLMCFWPRDFDAPVYALPRPQKPSTKSPQASQPNLPPSTATGTKSLSEAPNKDAHRLLDNRFLNAALVKQLLAALSKGHTELNSLNAIFQAIGQLLQKGMGMEFGAILVPNPEAGWVTKLQFDEQELAPINSALHQGLLVKLSAKPAAILINADNRSALASQLPDELAGKINERDALFISLLHNGRPVALLIAAEADLTPPRVQVCKQLASATQQAIARLALQIQRQSTRR